MEPHSSPLARNLGYNGEKGLIAEANWPDIKEWKSKKQDNIILPIQINGRRKAEISIALILLKRLLKNWFLKKR